MSNQKKEHIFKQNKISYFNLSIISEKGLSEARTDLIKSENEPNEDETVGSLVRRRLGDEVMENLVGPLLGGINAGNADTLSLEFGVPRLFEASRHDPSLINSINSFLSQQHFRPSRSIPAAWHSPHSVSAAWPSSATRRQ